MTTLYRPGIMEAVIDISESLNSNEIPIVAAVAIREKIISIRTNEVEKRKCPWAHAEYLAIQEACVKLQDKYLENASLYVILEPCAFCSAMLEKVRIKNIFFGAYNPKGGAIVHNSRIFDNSDVQPQIIGGIQEQRCSKIISDFFKGIRK